MAPAPAPACTCPPVAVRYLGHNEDCPSLRPPPAPAPVCPHNLKPCYYCEKGRCDDLSREVAAQKAEREYIIQRTQDEMKRAAVAEGEVERQEARAEAAEAALRAHYRAHHPAGKMVRVRDGKACREARAALAKKERA